MIFVPLLHYFLCKNDYSGNEAGLRYRLTRRSKRTVPDPDSGADATKEEDPHCGLLARALDDRQD